MFLTHFSLINCLGDINNKSQKNEIQPSKQECISVDFGAPWFYMLMNRHSLTTAQALCYNVEIILIMENLLYLGEVIVYLESSLLDPLILPSLCSSAALLMPSRNIR